MTQPKVYSWIKTTCGRAKYDELNAQKGILAQIRLGWFVVFAALRDWNVPSSDQIEDSES